MSGAPYHHGNLREALIDAALVILRDHGAEAVSLRALARDLGVSHAAPSRHFATRDALFAAIAERGYSALTDRIAAGRGTADDPLLRLRRMAEAHLDWALANPALYASMRNGDVLRHAGAALQARIADFARTQVGFVQAARATGWRQDEAAETTMLSILGGLTGLATLCIDPFLSGALAGFAPQDRIDPLLDRLLAP